jgi:hypothetical protein
MGVRVPNDRIGQLPIDGVEKIRLGFVSSVSKKAGKVHFGSTAFMGRATSSWVQT